VLDAFDGIEPVTEPTPGYCPTLQSFYDEFLSHAENTFAAKTAEDALHCLLWERYKRTTYEFVGILRRASSGT